MGTIVTLANDAKTRLENYVLPTCAEIIQVTTNRKFVTNIERDGFYTRFIWFFDYLQIEVGEMDGCGPIIMLVIDKYSLPNGDKDSSWKVWLELHRVCFLTQDPFDVACENGYVADRSMIDEPQTYVHRICDTGPLCNRGIADILELEYDNGVLTLCRTERLCIMPPTNESDQPSAYKSGTLRQTILARIVGDVDEAIIKLNNMIDGEG